MKNYVPLRIFDSYTPILFKENNSVMSKGRLCCSCSCKDFSIQYVGKLMKGIVGKISLYPSNENNLGITLSCNSCGKKLTLFDNRIDGYNAITKGASSIKRFFPEETKALSCPKCSKNQFFVEVKYEHLLKSETEQEGIQDYRNAFQWIWADLECSSCSKKLRSFLDIETG